MSTSPPSARSWRFWGRAAGVGRAPAVSAPLDRRGFIDQGTLLEKRVAGVAVRARGVARGSHPDALRRARDRQSVATIGSWARPAPLARGYGSQAWCPESDSLNASLRIRALAPFFLTLPRPPPSPPARRSDRKLFVSLTPAGEGGPFRRRIVVPWIRSKGVRWAREPRRWWRAWSSSWQR